MSNERYVCMDIETTGLNAESDAILEVAMLIIDAKTLDTLAQFDAPIRMSKSEIDFLRADADPFVVDMHDNSDLWNRCQGPKAMSLGEVRNDLVDMLSRHTISKNQTRLFGSSVHFDRTFLMEDMPELFEFISHRNMDVSSLAYWANQVMGVPYFDKQKKHTALADIRESLAEYKYISQSIDDLITGAINGK